MPKQSARKAKSPTLSVTDDGESDASFRSPSSHASSNRSTASPGSSPGRHRSRSLTRSRSRSASRSSSRGRDRKSRRDASPHARRKLNFESAVSPKVDRSCRNCKPKDATITALNTKVEERDKTINILTKKSDHFRKKTDLMLEDLNYYKSQVGKYRTRLADARQEARDNNERFRSDIVAAIQRWKPYGQLPAQPPAEQPAPPTKKLKPSVTDAPKKPAPTKPAPKEDGKKVAPPATEKPSASAAPTKAVAKAVTDKSVSNETGNLVTYRRCILRGKPLDRNLPAGLLPTKKDFQCAYIERKKPNGKYDYNHRSHQKTHHALEYNKNLTFLESMGVELQCTEDEYLLLNPNAKALKRKSAD